ncbi:hypothetical protein [Caldivirga sp.]|uniref:hypothetical protein n=1 Tax=Caldivirga sp. TaxID=2080243 RepID=UPI003D0F06E5
MRMVALLLMLLSISLVSLATYVPSPPVYVTVTKIYVISMNLSHSEPPWGYIESIKAGHPLTYSELTSEENATAPWIGASGLTLTLTIVNATPTPYPIALGSAALSNSTGGVRWIINVTYLTSTFNMHQSPLSLRARWFILITASINGLNLTVFAFKTGYEMLGDVLGNLSTIGGYLTEPSGYKYSLWHHYLYNGTLWYVVPLPGIVVFYTWFGNYVGKLMPLPTTINNQGTFPSYLRYFTVALRQYYNSTVINSSLASVNYALGNETDYGYYIFNIVRLAPLGPLAYYTPIIMLSNGTLANPTCLPIYYELSVVFQFENPAYGSFTPYLLFNELSHASSLITINDSLLLGGFLISYDFYNSTTLTITPLNSAISEGVNYTSCLVPIYDPVNVNKPLVIGGDASSASPNKPSGVMIPKPLLNAWLFRLLRIIINL